MTSKLENETAFPLWPGGAPGALGKDPGRDIPALTPYLPGPETATGAAVVICPGGGYEGLADHEGRDYALWLNLHGIAAFVLKYRLGAHGYRHPAMLHDVRRAIRVVRSRATEWGLDASRIGVMGSSAGGHLASTALTHFESGRPDDADPIERVGSRPDLGVLCYPVISMGDLTHEGSKRNLLGEEPPDELSALLSSEWQVTPETPPCFIWHTWEDDGVKVENSLEFAAALRRNGVPFDLHIFERGAHGIGLGVKGYHPAHTARADVHPWAHDLIYWLRGRGFAH